ncbi:Peptidase propeptide domain-containing protein [Desulfosporosinus orientis DSM 765]|uniref:Peptidase propeptide domain-containing protein n=1 Tax=Desulfosporosinus orientis (strain ATCC 19365 / DSM 765 / NCIMB 8382 / VKM B-1628 / Singapore I) TaxID=768706 RepID=G7WCE0_DESOD|nr:PepSY domain-containing protein [Desulfosporosinus orientis]AET66262.1 Peptidase propeptide domain-containing protein [Desulfosporosinus orientis DSM 765]
MKKAKWIVGLSMASVIAIAGTAYALTAGTSTLGLLGNANGFTQTVNKAVQGSQLETPKFSTLAISSQNDNSAKDNTLGANGYSGYGMMGGYGANGYGGYGMMGGYGVNGYGGYGMMGGYGANGYGGYGMMGGYGANGYGGYGMMGGYGANGYSGYGMMGSSFDAKSLGVDLTNGQVSTSDQALAIAKAYIQKTNQDVVVKELHEFSNGYEVELKDAQTGANAYELMVYKYGGQIITEMGPNIMWNTKYGYMNWGNTGDVTVSEEQATNIAKEFLSQMGDEYSLEKPELSPGYYEFMIQKDGKDYSELDVNGYTGQVWLENWQGPILNTVEVK